MNCNSLPIGNLTPQYKVNTVGEECDYFANPTKLFKRCEEGNWDLAIQRLEMYPNEAKMWIVRKSKSEKAISWRRLPLHEACRHKPPKVLIDLLVAANSNGPQEKDLNGRLPLHHACVYGTTVDDIESLLTAYPESAQIEDSWGKTPSTYLENSLHPDKELLEVLKVGPRYYEDNIPDSKVEEAVWKASVDIEMRHAEEVEVISKIAAEERDTALQEIVKLEGEIAKLSERLSGSLDQENILLKENVKLQSEVESLQGEVANKEREKFTEKQSHQSEILILREKIHDVEFNLKNAQESCKKEVDKLQRDREVAIKEKEAILKNEGILEMKIKDGEKVMEEKIAEIAGLEKTNKELEMKLQDAVESILLAEKNFLEEQKLNDEEFKGFETHIEEANAEIEALEKKLEETTDEFNQFKEKTEKEKRQSQEEAAALRDSMNNLENKYKGIIKDMKMKHDAELLQAREEIEELEANLESTSTEKRELEKEVDILDSLLPVRDAKIEKLEMQQKLLLSDAEKVSDDLKKSSEKAIVILEAKNTELETKVKDLQCQLEKEKDERISFETKMEKELGMKEEQKKEYLDIITNVEKNLNEADYTIQSLREKHDRMENEIEYIKIDSDKEIDNLNNTIHELNKQNTQFREKINDLKEMLSSSESKSSQYESLIEELEELSSHNREYRESLTNADEEIDRLKSDIKKLKQSNISLEISNEELSINLQKERKNASLVNKKEEDFAQLNEDIKQLRQVILSQEVQIDDLQKKLHQDKNEISDLRSQADEFATLKKNLKELEFENSRLSLKNESLEKDIEANKMYSDKFKDNMTNRMAKMDLTYEGGKYDASNEMLNKKYSNTTANTRNTSNDKESEGSPNQDLFSTTSNRRDYERGEDNMSTISDCSRSFHSIERDNRRSGRYYQHNSRTQQSKPISGSKPLPAVEVSRSRMRDHSLDVERRDDNDVNNITRSDSNLSGRGPRPQRDCHEDRSVTDVDWSSRGPGRSRAPEKTTTQPSSRYRSFSPSVRSITNDNKAFERSDPLQKNSYSSRRRASPTSSWRPNERFDQERGSTALTPTARGRRHYPDNEMRNMRDEFPPSTRTSSSPLSVSNGERHKITNLISRFEYK